MNVEAIVCMRLVMARMFRCNGNLETSDVKKLLKEFDLEYDRPTYLEDITRHVFRGY